MNPQQPLIFGPLISRAIRKPLKTRWYKACSVFGMLILPTGNLPRAVEIPVLQQPHLGRSSHVVRAQERGGFRGLDSVLHKTK